MKIDDVTIEITNQCCLRCLHCDIWREKAKHQISEADVVQGLDHLFSVAKVYGVSITGGEPFLHPDIRGILRYLSRLKVQNKLASFGVYTNGARPDLVADVLRKDHRFLAGMSVGISVDGDQKMHDMIRGKGAYTRVVRLLELFHGKYFDLFDVELKFTLNALNFRHMEDVYRLAVRYNARFTPKLVEQDVGTYYHRFRGGSNKAKTLPDGDWVDLLQQQFASILRNESRRKKKLVHPKMLRMVSALATKGVGAIRSCRTPARTLFITSRGLIYSCLYMPPVGALDDKNLFSGQFPAKRESRIKRGSSAECPRCMSYHGFLKDFNAGLLA